MLKNILCFVFLTVVYIFGENAIDYKFQYYIDNNQVNVLSNDISATKKINENVTFSLSYLVDAITGASRKDHRGVIKSSALASSQNSSVDAITPASKVDGVSSATKNDELRHQPSATLILVNDFFKMMGGSKNSDNPTTLSITGINSQENDYVSRTVSSALSQDLFERNTTLGVRYGKSYNKFEPASRFKPGDSDLGWNYFGNGKRETDNLSVSLTQGITTTTIAAFIWGYSYDRGYLARPYYVFKINDTADGGTLSQFYNELLPTNHKSMTFTGSLNQYIPVGKGISLHLDYRYYLDSWNQKSNTLLIELYSYLTDKIVLRPSMRIYSQSSTFFYKDQYSTNDYVTTDLRYRGCNAYTYGLKASYLIKDFVKPEKASFLGVYPVAFDIGLDYYTRSSPKDSATLYNYYQYYKPSSDFSTMLIQTGMRFIF